MTEAAARDARPGQLPAALALKGIGKRYGGRRALHDVGFELPQGATLVIFGANGAGKTTLLRILSLLERPSEGTFAVLGFDPRKDGDEIRLRIGLISHEPMLYLDLTARENLVLFAQLYGLADPQGRADEMLRRVRLAHRANDAVRGFSRGMTQRMSLARALIHDPSLVYLDEPYSGLDPSAVALADELISAPREGLRRPAGDVAAAPAPRTLVMTSHDPERGWRQGTHFLLLSRGSQVLFAAKEELGYEEFRSLYDGQLTRGQR